MALAFFHIYRALAAMMFHDDAALVRHAETAASLTPHITGFYPTALANLLHSLARSSTSRMPSRTPGMVIAICKARRIPSPPALSGVSPVRTCST